MDIMELINKVIVLVGVPAILAVFIQIGRRFQLLDHLQSDVKDIKYELHEVKGQITQLEVRVTQIEVKLDIIWQRIFKNSTNAVEP